MHKKIEITVNGLKEKVAPDTTVGQLILKYEEADAHLIVERNGKFVYPQDYEATRVVEGDILEFINPNFGG